MTSGRLRLEGWKEISAYLKRDQRTAQRWKASDALPVYTLQGRVFAFADELDQWLAQRTKAPQFSPDPPEQAQPLAPEPSTEPDPPPSRSAAPRRPASVLGLVLAGLAGLVLLGPMPGPPGPPSIPPFGRILIRATSENSRPRRIPLSHPPYVLALSPDGGTLFGVGEDGRTLSVVDLASGRLREYPLPARCFAMVASRDGRLYLGSIYDGVIVVWEIRTATVVRVVPAGGNVGALALSPDGRKLFVAVWYKGLLRLSLPGGELTKISDRVCPVGLDMDRSEKRLFISYQCGGPSGRSGHDQVEVFDVDRETPAGLLGGGVPMVASGVSASPNGNLLAVHAGDVCLNPTYDRNSCPSYPSNLVHVFRAPDRRLLHTLVYPDHFSRPIFLDDSRILLSGDGLAVADARSYATLERFAVSEDPYIKPVVSPDRRHVYTGRVDDSALLAFDVEDGSCAASEGAAMTFSGDGTWADTDMPNGLERQGAVGFAPGKVGQAFSFDGGRLVARWTSIYDFGPADFAISLYAKFSDIAGERVLLDRPRPFNSGVRIYLDSEARLAARVAISEREDVTLRSPTSSEANVWEHVVLSHEGRRLALYINGVLADSAPLPAAETAQPDSTSPLFIGADSAGSDSFAGKLDEIAFYNRGLSADDVKRLYSLREAGPCKP